MTFRFESLVKYKKEKRVSMSSTAIKEEMDSHCHKLTTLSLTGTLAVEHTAYD